MNPETIELIRYALSQAKEAAVVILPAVVAGYFALNAGRRDSKLELAKLRAEQEFSARSRFYDYLKEQQTRIQASHTALSDGIEKVLAGYHEGVTKVDIARLGDDDAAKEKAKLTEIIQPLLDTFSYSLRSQSRAMRDERDSLLGYYQEHCSKDLAGIESLRKLTFPDVTVTSGQSIEAIRDTAFQLIEANRVIANHGHRALQADIEAQLERYFT
jgi:hypothetical protein